MKTSAQQPPKTLFITHVRHSRCSDSTFSFAIQGKKDSTDTVSLVIDYGDRTKHTVNTTEYTDMFCYCGTWNYEKPGHFTVIITAVGSPSGQTETVGTTICRSASRKKLL
jgi:hypothetical protein